MKARTRTFLAATLAIVAFGMAGSAAADDHGRWGHDGHSWNHRWDRGDHRHWRDHRDWDGRGYWRDHWVTPGPRFIIRGGPAYYGPPVYYAPSYPYYRPVYPRHPSVVIGVQVPPLVIPLR